jgi:hypothetical protein
MPLEPPSQGNSLIHQTSQLTDGHKRQPMLTAQPQTNVGIEVAVNMGAGQKNHAQLEFLMKALQEETIGHNATRENLVAFRNAAWRWERSAIYEQSEHRSMAEKFRLGENNRNVLEERLRSLQTDFDQMAATLALRASHELNIVCTSLFLGHTLTSIRESLIPQPPLVMSPPVSAPLSACLY